MKRIVLSLLLLLSSVSIYAQEMPSVAGVTFGMGINTCKKILDKKFTAEGESEQENKYALYYYDVQFAEQFFDACSFLFQEKGGATFLKDIIFIDDLPPEQVNEAKRKRDRLFRIYKEKYEPRWEKVDKNGFKYYALGYRPNSDDPLVTISIHKGFPPLEGKQILVVLHYSVDNFVDPTEDI